MAFEDVLVKPAVFLKEQPKAMLPAALLLVPQVLFLAVATIFLSANASLFQASAFQQALQDPSAAIEKMLSLIAQLALPVIAVVIISWIVQLVLSLVFVEIALQIREKKKQVRLKEAFDNALKKGKLGRFAIASLIGYALVLIVAILAVILTALLIAFFGVVASVAGTIAGVLAAILIGGAAVLFLLAAIALSGATFWLLPTVISLEGKEAWQALKKSFELARAKPIQYLALVLVTAVISIVFSQVSNLLGAIPLLGYALSQLVMLPFTAWAMLLSTGFYFTYLKK